MFRSAALLKTLLLLAALAPLALPAAAACASPVDNLVLKCGDDGTPTLVRAEQDGVGGATVYANDEVHYPDVTFRRTGAGAWAGPVGLGASSICSDYGNDGSCEQTRTQAQLATPAYVGMSLTEYGDGSVTVCAYVSPVSRCVNSGWVLP